METRVFPFLFSCSPSISLCHLECSQPPRCSKPPKYCIWAMTLLSNCLCVCVRLESFTSFPCHPHPSFSRFFVCRFPEGHRHNLHYIIHISTLKLACKNSIVYHVYFFYTEQQFVQGLYLSTGCLFCVFCPVIRDHPILKNEMCCLIMKSFHEHPEY